MQYSINYHIVFSSGSVAQSHALTKTIRGYTGHEMLPHFALINMNGRMYDPVLGRMLSPDNYVQDPNNAQNYNRYAYVLNNPLKYTDPSGEKWWHWLLGEILTGGMVSISIATAAGTAVTMSIDAANYAVTSGTIGAIHGFFSQGSSRLENAWEEGSNRFINAAKIYGGIFVTDPNKSTEERIIEFSSRFYWQTPQVTAGYMLSQGRNAIGNVTSVDYMWGATFSHVKSDYGSVSLGNFINLDNDDKETNMIIGKGGYTTMHEYGHYIQSQKNGPSYLFKFGIPSALKDRDWTELDANLRASRYFKENYGFDWNQEYNGGSRYTRFPNNGKVTNTQWWEWPIFPISFIWN